MSLFSQNVGIGTSTPMEKLHVAGNLRVDGLAGANDRLVAADANGTLFPVAAGLPGQVLVQGATGPVWQSGAYWKLAGNAGTTPAADFIGTTDAAALAFRTQNVEAMRITPDGLVCVNGTGPFAVDRFSVYADGNQDAVSGYTFGTGTAGYFESLGSGNGLRSTVNGPGGSAGQFLTLGTSAAPTISAWNFAGTGEALQVRTDQAIATAHGITVDVNGASTQRGVLVDMDAANFGVGVSVLHYGLSNAAYFQNFNPAATSSGIVGEHYGNARGLSIRNFLTTGTVQCGLFVQGSNGLTPGTYANATSIWAQSDGIRGGAVISNGSSANNTVLQALYNGPAGNYDGVAVLGLFSPSASYGYGVVGQGNWYGVFANGNLGGSGAKTFMIDHPQDPAQKFLRHFSIESPEVLNLYRGTVVLDATGSAQVQLPSYFHAINTDFSYQLTAIGGPSQAYIQTEIAANGQFAIAGGQPGQKICWVVYAQRNDPYVQQNPDAITVEVDKRPHDRGLYLQPQLYGQPKEKGMFYRNQVRPDELESEETVAPPASTGYVPQLPTPKQKSDR